MAPRTTGGNDKRVSGVEGSPEPPKALFIHRLVAERSPGKSEGSADSLSELVC